MLDPPILTKQKNMKANTENNTAAAETLTFTPKDVRTKFNDLIEELIEGGSVKTGKEASCGKDTYIMILAGMLVEMGVIPPARYEAALSVFDAIPAANASAMKQLFEKWNESEAAISKKSNALAAKYSKGT